MDALHSCRNRLGVDASIALGGLTLAKDDSPSARSDAAMQLFVLLVVWGVLYVCWYGLTLAVTSLVDWLKGGGS